MAMDKEFVQALMQTMMNADPAELIKMMQGAKIDLKATIEDIPLEIGIRFKKGEIHARVKFTEEQETDGDQSKTD